MKKALLTVLAVTINASFGWAGGSLESAAVGASDAMRAAARAKITPPAGLISASPAPTNPVVPLPPRRDALISAAQLRRLATVAAEIYNKQGRPRSAGWYCVNADDVEMTGRATDAQHCIRVTGDVEGNNYRFSTAEIKFEVYGDGVTRFFGIPTGQERVLLAADSCVVHGNGSIDGIAGQKTFDNVSMPDLNSVLANEINFWLNYNKS